MVKLGLSRLQTMQLLRSSRSAAKITEKSVKVQAREPMFDISNIDVTVKVGIHINSIGIKREV